MRKFYQNKWHGIIFNDICDVSRKKLPKNEFYNSFYKEFFLRKSSYKDLDDWWKIYKSEIADWLAQDIKEGAKVLSIGCGIGFIERILYKNYSHFDLYVQDFAKSAHKWLNEIIPNEKIFDTDNFSALPQSKFDIIYLSAVDYAVDDSGLESLLENLSSILKKNGSLYLISASFNNGGLLKNFTEQLKEIIKMSLELFSLRSPSQFWGWMRTRDEYISILEKSGFVDIDYGFIETTYGKTFWIKGS
jgi:SAM-dependent methyltransferase